MQVVLRLVFNVAKAKPEQIVNFYNDVAFRTHQADRAALYIFFLERSPEYCIAVGAEGTN